MNALILALQNHPDTWRKWIILSCLLLGVLITLTLALTSSSFLIFLSMPIITPASALYVGWILTVLSGLLIGSCAALLIIGMLSLPWEVWTTQKTQEASKAEVAFKREDLAKQSDAMTLTPSVSNHSLGEHAPQDPVVKTPPLTPASLEVSDPPTAISAPPSPNLTIQTKNLNLPDAHPTELIFSSSLTSKSEEPLSVLEPPVTPTRITGDVSISTLITKAHSPIVSDSFSPVKETTVGEETPLLDDETWIEVLP